MSRQPLQPSEQTSAEEAKSKITSIYRYNKTRRLALGEPLQAQVHVTYSDKEPEEIVERIEQNLTTDGELVTIGVRRWVWRLTLATTIIEPFTPSQSDKILRIMEKISDRLDVARTNKIKADHVPNEDSHAWQSYIAGLEYALDDIKEVINED